MLTYAVRTQILHIFQWHLAFNPLTLSFIVNWTVACQKYCCFPKFSLRVSSIQSRLIRTSIPLHSIDRYCCLPDLKTGGKINRNMYYICGSLNLLLVIGCNRVGCNKIDDSKSIVCWSTYQLKCSWIILNSILFVWIFYRDNRFCDVFRLFFWYSIWSFCYSSICQHNYFYHIEPRAALIIQLFVNRVSVCELRLRTKKIAPDNNYSDFPLRYECSWKKSFWFRGIEKPFQLKSHRSIETCELKRCYVWTDEHEHGTQ